MSNVAASPLSERSDGRLRPTGSWLAWACPAVVLIVVIAWILAPGLFSGFDPLVGDPSTVFAPPSGEHWFGTDQLGRDVFSRVVHGSSMTALTAGVSVLGGLFVGSLLGLFAATAGSVVEVVVMRIIDVLIALPSFLVAILTVTLVGRGPWSLALGVAVGSIALFARVMRSEAIKVRSTDYVSAARMSGSGYWRVLITRILPNAAGPVLALAVVELGSAILTIAALGFMGFGAPPPTPEWGLIVADGRNYLGTAWWICTLPGAVIGVVVLSVGALGRELRARTRL